MNTKRKELSDLTILIISHAIGFLVVAGYAAFAHELSEAFPNIVGKLLLPTNLSLWEQGKMLVVPLCIIFPIEYFIVGRKFSNFIPAHLIIAFCLPMLLLGVFHVHGFIFGNRLSLEGAQTILSLALLLASFLASILLVTTEKDLTKYTIVFTILYIILAISYVVFSFMPPHSESFFDPINELFGPAYG